MLAAAERTPGPLDRLLRVLPADGTCMRLKRVVAVSGLETGYVRRKLKALVGMALVGNRMRGCYWLTDDGISLRNAGLSIGKDRNRRSGTDLLVDRLWSAARMEGKFSRSSLLSLAVRDSDRNPADYARDWLRKLENAGVIAPLPPYRGSEKRWRLVHDLGPQPLTWSHTHKAMWDWNANRLVSASIEAAREATP